MSLSRLARCVERLRSVGVALLHFIERQGKETYLLRPRCCQTHRYF
jgi:hypothetical protein